MTRSDEGRGLLNNNICEIIAKRTAEQNSIVYGCVKKNILICSNGYFEDLFNILI